MTREKKIAILMEDYCTQKEAIKHLDAGASIFTEAEIDAYLDEFNKDAYDEDDILTREDFEQHKDCCSVVMYEGKKYYIAYVL